MYEQLYSKTGVRAIVGSGLLWAWYDCLFMSSFFPFDRGTGFMPEFAYLLIQLACTAFYTVVVTRSDWGARLLANRWSVWGSGALGTLGSFALVGSNALSGSFSTALFFVGCLLCASFMAVMTLAWGAVYSTGGSITATPLCGRGVCLRHRLRPAALLYVSPGGGLLRRVPPALVPGVREHRPR